ncbi:hypothetical protein J6590_100910 [Homalodisca vitripennis]|nr:hypothetical protein J6590_100910 [Homalodisca vitripennis]
MSCRPMVDPLRRSTPRRLRVVKFSGVPGAEGPHHEGVHKRSEGPNREQPRHWSILLQLLLPGRRHRLPAVVIRHCDLDYAYDVDRPVDR